MHFSELLSPNGGGGRNPAPSPLPAPAMMEAKRRSANRIGRYERVRRSGNALRPLSGQQRHPCHVPRLLHWMEGYITPILPLLRSLVISMYSILTVLGFCCISIENAFSIFLSLMNHFVVHFLMEVGIPASTPMMPELHWWWDQRGFYMRCPWTGGRYWQREGDASCHGRIQANLRSNLVREGSS